MAEFILSGFLDEAAADLSGQVEACRENGVRFIEMRGVNGRSLVDQSLAEAKEIRRVLDGEGLRLSSIGSPFGKIGIKDPLAPHLDKLRHAMEIADVLDVKLLRMFSFYMPEGEDPAAYREQVMDGVDAMLRVCEDAGVQACHENEKGIYGDVTSRCLDLYQTFAGRMPGVFDPANFIQCGVKPPEAWPVLEPYVYYMHIKDALLATGQVVPAGEGDGHVAELLSRFGEKDGKRFLSLEPHLKVFAGLETLETDDVSARAMRGYPSGQAAFRAAADALKRVLSSIGYVETETGVYQKGANHD